MSGAMENRAAVFTSQPQDVQVYRDGAWWPGSLLGWRHDVHGGCQVWVRVVVRGDEETSWLALDLLRLPEPVAEPVAEPERPLNVVSVVAEPAPAGPDVPREARADDSSLTGTMAAIRAVPVPKKRRATDRPVSAELTSTRSLFGVRDLSDEPHAAPSPRPPGGRRRAPQPASGEQPAVSAASAMPGRHRAPAAGGSGLAGRHRAADTEVWPVIRDDEPVRLMAPPRPKTTIPATNEPDAAFLTRPMRLDEALEGAVPRPRGPRRDGRLIG